MQCCLTEDDVEEFVDELPRELDAHGAEVKVRLLGLRSLRWLHQAHPRRGQGVTEHHQQKKRALRRTGERLHVMLTRTAIASCSVPLSLLREGDHTLFIVCFSFKIEQKQRTHQRSRKPHDGTVS